TAAADVQRTVLIHHRVVTRDFRAGRALTINGGFTVIVYGGFITVNLRAGAAVTDGVVTVVVDDVFVAVDQNTDGIRIGNRHTALVALRSVLPGALTIVTAAADVQRTVLIHYSVITRDFRAGGIF